MINDRRELIKRAIKGQTSLNKEELANVLTLFSPEEVSLDWDRRELTILGWNAVFSWKKQR